MGDVRVYEVVGGVRGYQGVGGDVREYEGMGERC